LQRLQHSATATALPKFREYGSWEDNLFIKGGFGRLLDVGKSFEKGTFYKVGFGFQIFDDDYRNSTLIGLDFNRKQFGFLRSEKISSVSVYFEFQLF